MGKMLAVNFCSVHTLSDTSVDVLQAHSLHYECCNETKIYVKLLGLCVCTSTISNRQRVHKLVMVISFSLKINSFKMQQHCFQNYSVCY
jgi:hypothetical protein